MKPFVINHALICLCTCAHTTWPGISGGPSSTADRSRRQGRQPGHQLPRCGASLFHNSGEQIESNDHAGTQ